MTYEPSLTTYHCAIVQSKELEAAKNPKSIHLKPRGITLDIGTPGYPGGLDCGIDSSRPTGLLWL